jgi:hypothetical protein
MTDDSQSPSLSPVRSDGTLDQSRLFSIVYQIGRSFAFFVTNFCWIENKTESGVRIGESKFTLWPAQRPLPRLFILHRLIAILKARQLGLTWFCAAYVLWKSITRRGFLTVVISANQDWAVEFLDRVRFMWNRLPEWLMPELSKDGSEQMRVVFEWDKEHKRALIYSDIKSLTTTPAGAQSKTPDLLILDETARNRYVEQIYGASKPGIDKAGGQIIVISNAHKRGPGWAWTRDICSMANKKENDFYFLFLPWWACPERITDHEKEELARDPDFVPKDFIAQQLREGMQPEDIVENYPANPEEALAAIQGSYFGEVLGRHGRYCIDGIKGSLYRDKHQDGELFFKPAELGFPGGHGSNIITVWRHPYWLTRRWDKQYWSGRYVMGSDVSEGQGRSYSVAYVMDRKLDEFVARIRSNRVDAVDWATYLWLLSLYYSNFHVRGTGEALGKTPAMICVEKTGAGLTTVKELQKVGANQFIRQLFDKRGDSTTNNIGWHEDTQSKHVLCGDLRNWYRTCVGRIYCQILLDESATTIEHENGRIGPEEGRTWDTVVAAGCTLQASIQTGGPPAIVRSISHDAAPMVSNWGR